MSLCKRHSSINRYLLIELLKLYNNNSISTCIVIHKFILNIFIPCFIRTATAN